MKDLNILNDGNLHCFLLLDTILIHIFIHEIYQLHMFSPISVTFQAELELHEYYMLAYAFYQRRVNRYF